MIGDMTIFVPQQKIRDKCHSISIDTEKEGFLIYVRPLDLAGL